MGTENITQTTVNRLLRDAADTKRKYQYEVRDKGCGGLSIRVRARSAVWTLRTRIGGTKGTLTTIAIGPVTALRDPDLVRQLAERGKARAKAGENPKAMFEAAIEAQTVEHAEAIERSSKGQEWTWSECCEKYLEVVEKYNRPDTHRTYSSALQHETFAPLKSMLLSQITATDIRKCRDTLAALGKNRQLASTMQQVRACMAWACEHEKESGISISVAAGVKTFVKTKSVSIEEAIAEQEFDPELENSFNRRLSEREIGILQRETRSMKIEDRLMTILALYTAQRRLTVASALKRAFVQHPEYGFCWIIHPGSRKTGTVRSRNKNRGSKPKRPHAIPLPPAAEKAVKQALEVCSREDLPWLFPQLRLRRKGDAGDRHISVKSLNESFKSLQAEGKPLHSDDIFSPHDLRHTFVTYMSETRKVPKKLYTLITEHSEGRDDEGTSETHYNAYLMMPEKSDVLKIWSDYLEKAAKKYSKGD